jgi:hypothetical protein
MVEPDKTGRSSLRKKRGLEKRSGKKRMNAPPKAGREEEGEN